MSARSTARFSYVSRGLFSAVLASGLVLGLAPNAAALSSSSSLFPVTPGPSISQPGPSNNTPTPNGEAVSLYELRDSGTAAKGPVAIGGTQYPNSWSFPRHADLKVELNGDYTTLSGTFGIEDDSAAVESVQLHIKRDFVNTAVFTVTKDHPIRDIEIDVSGVEELQVKVVMGNSGVKGERKVGFANPVVYK